MPTVRPAVRRRLSASYWLGRESDHLPVHVVVKRGMRSKERKPYQVAHGGEVMELYLVDEDVNLPDEAFCAGCIRVIDLQTPRSPKDTSVRNVILKGL